MAEAIDMDYNSICVILKSKIKSGKRNQAHWQRSYHLRERLIEDVPKTLKLCGMEKCPLNAGSFVKCATEGRAADPGFKSKGKIRILRITLIVCTIEDNGRKKYTIQE